jgi:hypothetical protein
MIEGYQDTKKDSAQHQRNERQLTPLSSRKRLHF